MSTLKVLTVLALVCGMGASSALAAAPALPDKDADIDVGVPLWSSAPPNKPMLLDIKQKDPANPAQLKTTQVKVDDLPAFTFNFAAFVAPVRMMGETLPQYRARYTLAAQAYTAARLAASKAAWEAASKDKADRIAAQINTQIAAGTASVSTFVNAAGYTQARVTIVNCHGIDYGKKSNTTGEVGDGAKFKNGAGGGSTSPGYKGSMGSITPGTSVPVATGVDPAGGPSEIDFGISGVYVSTYFPLAGDTVDSVMQTMASDLSAHGVPATFSPSLEELTLDNTYTDGDELVWGLSEPAFDGALGITWGTTTEPEAVPEPASLGVMGLAGVGLLRRRQVGV